MYIHIFMFRWKVGSTLEQHQRAAREISAFAGSVPGLLEITVGENLAANHQGYTFGGCMKFSDALAYQQYCGHALHQRLLDWLVPLIEAAELDLPMR